MYLLLNFMITHVACHFRHLAEVVLKMHFSFSIHTVALFMLQLSVHTTGQGNNCTWPFSAFHSVN